MNNTTGLQHHQLQDLYSKGRVCLRVDTGRALHVCDKDPRARKFVKAEYKIWKWLGLLLFVGAPLLLFWLPWYVAASVFAGGLVILSAARKRAAQFLSDAVIRDESLYKDCAQNGIIFVANNSSQLRV